MGNVLAHVRRNGLLSCVCDESMRVDGHKVDTEDPNLFLRLLQEQHQDIWQDVWRNNNKYVICIPQSVSLRHRVRREDIENHVLRAAPFGGGDYTTLNGKRVGLAGGELVTKQTGAAQWADERRVRIICTEDLGNPSDQGGGADGDGGGDARGSSIAVLHLSRPLAGGVDAPEVMEELDRATLYRYVAMLRSYPENEPVFADLDRFIARVKHSAEHGELGQCVDPTLERRLGERWRSASRALMRTGSFNYASCMPRARLRHEQQIQQAVEAYMLEPCHAGIISWLRRPAGEGAADARLRRGLWRLRHFSQQDLGVDPAFQAPLGSAVACLAGLVALSTPLEKLMCVKRASELFGRAIEENLTEHYRDKGAYQLTTDDLLDSLVYVLLQASQRGGALADLGSQLAFMTRFHFPNISSTVLGFNLANFEVAVGWLAARGGDSDEEDGEARAAGEGGGPAAHDPFEAGEGGRTRARVAAVLRAREANARESELWRALAAAAPAAAAVAAPAAPAPSAADKAAAGSTVLVFGRHRWSAAAVTSVSIGPGSIGPGQGLKDRGFKKGGARAQETAAGAPAVAASAQLACGQQFFTAIDGHDKLLSWGVSESGCLGRGGAGAVEDDRQGCRSGGSFPMVGDRCAVHPGERAGSVVYVGPVQKLPAGVWVGVRLDQALGKNDGSVFGERVFTCELNHGVFAKPENVRVVTAHAARLLGHGNGGGGGGGGGAAAVAAAAAAARPLSTEQAQVERVAARRNSVDPLTLSSSRSEAERDAARAAAWAAHPTMLKLPVVGPNPQPFCAVAAVSCGAFHALAIAGPSRVLLAWGDNRCGQLGIGKDYDSFGSPCAVPGMRRWAVLALAAGGQHSLAIATKRSEEDEDWGGDGGVGGGGGATAAATAAGSGGSEGGSTFAAAEITRTTRAGSAASEKEDDSRYTAQTVPLHARSAPPALFSWGREKCGRLGRAAGDGGSSFLPGEVRLEFGRVAAAAEADANDTRRSPPGDSSAPDGAEVAAAAVAAGGRDDQLVAVAAGWSHSLALTAGGAAFAWGNGEDGRLGHGSHCDVWRPAPVLALLAPSLRVNAIAAGFSHSLLLTKGGVLFACGGDKYGQLGQGGKAAKQGAAGAEAASASASVVDDDPAPGAALLVPTAVSAPLRGLTIKSIGCGDHHNFAVAADGRAFVWGLNQRGQCGGDDDSAAAREGAQPTTAAQPFVGVPTELPCARDARIIAAGAHHTLVAPGEHAVALAAVRGSMTATESSAKAANEAAEALQVAAAAEVQGPVDL